MNAENKCQFADKTHLTHRPFSERAPICWDCFNAAIDSLGNDLDAAEAERDAALDLLREIANTIPTSPERGHAAWARELAHAFLSTRTPREGK